MIFISLYLVQKWLIQITDRKGWAKFLLEKILLTLWGKLLDKFFFKEFRLFFKVFLYKIFHIQIRQLFIQNVPWGLLVLVFA